MSKSWYRCAGKYVNEGTTEFVYKRGGRKEKGEEVKGKVKRLTDTVMPKLYWIFFRIFKKETKNSNYQKRIYDVMFVKVMFYAVTYSS